MDTELVKSYFNDKPVDEVYLFGSYSRNQQNENSDIDLLISLSDNNNINLFDFIG